MHSLYYETDFRATGTERESMKEIALGLVNTVDYEMEWDSAYLEKMISLAGLRKRDIEEKKEIDTVKDLLSSILFHMEEGTGCGLMTERAEVIEEFVKGIRYRVTLGGTNLRAAEVISALGGSAFVHLVSVNEDTIRQMPERVEWIGGEKYHCSFPHLAVQFPKNACIRANDIEIMTKRANRVIYSGDIACAQMPLEKAFFERAAGAGVLLLSGFDLIKEADILSARLQEVKEQIESFGENGPLIFYEHAHFGDRKFEDMVRRKLGELIDIYSMNEDEFRTLTGKKADLLNAEEVCAALGSARDALGGMTFIVHTCHWSLALGERAREIENALKTGMTAASARYRGGSVDKSGIREVGRLPLKREAEVFSREVKALLGGDMVCLPVADIRTDTPVTVGLGDAFVGGFLYQYCADKTGRET